MIQEVKIGMLTGSVICALIILCYVFGWEQQPVGKYIPYLKIVLIAASVYLALLQRRDHSQRGVMSLKEGFLSGMVVSFVIGFMAGLTMMVYVKFGDPGFANRMIEQAKETFLNTGFNETDWQKRESGIRAAYSPFGQLTYGIGSNMLFGAVVSFVCAMVMQNKGTQK